MNIFKIAYWAGILLQIGIRFPYQKTWKSGRMADRRVSPLERALFGLLSVGSFFVPLIYSVTGWLDFANYTLPAWMGWAGIALLIGSLLIFARGHIDLKSNWSPSLEIREDHTLVTDGIYRHIRHPMYASQWLWVIAQILLLQNWVAGPMGLILFIPFYLLRVPAEEKMMLDAFGDKYREYMSRVGGVVPKL
jgi:protein-S-isoprenylcysteine O-methyltransferase Ste14